MNTDHPADLALLVFRCGLGVVMLAHGWNHVSGGGKIAGTARWFESIGMKPGILHAWVASVTELGAGTMLILGFATPLACAAVIGTMVVALITNHIKNGFFIFRPGEGYEYVMTLIVASVALAGVGAGQWSLDHALEWFHTASWWPLGIAVIGGVGTATATLGCFWRPEPARVDAGV